MGRVQEEKPKERRVDGCTKRVVRQRERLNVLASPQRRGSYTAMRSLLRSFLSFGSIDGRLRATLPFSISDPGPGNALNDT